MKGSLSLVLSTYLSGGERAVLQGSRHAKVEVGGVVQFKTNWELNVFT